MLPPNQFISDQQTPRNGITGNGNGGVVLGQIGESILYYQNDQNQSFQL